MNEQYGPDTEELLRRIAAIENGHLDVSNLNIVGLPELPDGLRVLLCDATPLTSLPRLPSTLTKLVCSNNPYLTKLPDLPIGLETLYCWNTGLQILPDLPLSLKRLDCRVNSSLLLPREEGESIPSYNARWTEWKKQHSNHSKNIPMKLFTFGV